MFSDIFKTWRQELKLYSNLHKNQGVRYFSECHDKKTLIMRAAKNDDRVYLISKRKKHVFQFWQFTNVVGKLSEPSGVNIVK